MAFLEDPRLRQRWNHITQTTETVTDNAAAGIWSFGHTYITPCLGSIASSFDNCTSHCVGDREGRARRARERRRGRGQAEFSFDFYDDWDEEFGGDQDGGLLGSWGRAEDWDRLVAGTGKRKGPAGEIQDQPRTRNRGMSYGTRGTRRRASTHEDPTIIPSTSAIGFLGRLPFKIGGTLRYKPSAADLQEHPGSMRLAVDGEREPLLGNEDYHETHPRDLPTQSRKRSGTAGSGDTSDSFRSRGDLFPSDEEGDEDAVPLDDEFTIDIDHHDDRSSMHTKSSKGKRIASYRISRSQSRTTIDSAQPSFPQKHSASDPTSPELPLTQSLDDLSQEELQLELDEDEEIEAKRQAAAELALRRGLSRENLQIASVPEVKSEILQVEGVPAPRMAILDDARLDTPSTQNGAEIEVSTAHQREEPRLPTAASRSGIQDDDEEGDDFIPARLPHFR